MAISFIRSGGVAGTSFSFDIGSAGTDRLVAVLTGNEAETTLTGVTVDGKACTKVLHEINTDGIGNTSELWYIDEDGLGSSNGSVTVAIQGGDSGYAVHAHLYTGVIQTGPYDNNGGQSVGGTTVTVTGIDAPANGIVIMGGGHGASGDVSSYTSPLTERTDGPDPASAVFGTASGIESSGASNKSYTQTFSAGLNRSSAVVGVWAEQPSGPEITDVETDETFDDKDTNLTITGQNFEASQGTGKVELGDNSDYATANKIEQTVTAWADTSIDFTADLGAQSPGAKFIFVTNDSGEKNDPGFQVTVFRAEAFIISASDNIPASGAATTAQLTAPATKTTGDFVAGRIQDDENPSDAIDITADDYTELEYCLKAKDDANLVSYDFRITIDGVPLNTYAVTPQVIVVLGQTIDATAADGITISETVAKRAILSAGIIEGVDVGETPGGLGNLFEIATDGVTLGETLQVGANFVASAADGVIIADTNLVGAMLTAALTDGATLGDSSTVVKTADGLAADGVGIGDDPAPISNLKGVALDGALMSEILARIKSTPGSATDGATFGDSSAIGKRAAGIATDGAALGETLTRSKSASGLVIDGAELGDQSSPILTLIGAALDGSIIADDPATLARLHATAADGLTLGDSLALTAVLMAIATDSTILTDINMIGLLGAKQASAADGLNLGDTPSPAVKFLGAVSDGFSVGDQIAVILKAFATAADGLVIGDTSIVNLIGIVIQALAADGVQFSESITPTARLMADAGDGVTLSEIIERIKTAQVTATDGAALGDAAAMGRTSQAAVTDGAIMADLSVLGRLLSGLSIDGATLGETLATVRNLTATAPDGAALGDTPAATLNITATVADGLEFAEAVGALAKFAALAADGLKIRDVSYFMLPTGFVIMRFRANDIEMQFTTLSDTGKLTFSANCPKITFN